MHDLDPDAFLEDVHSFRVLVPGGGGLFSGLEPEVLEEGQEQALAWLIERRDDHERAEIDSIARALERIDRGEHGICEDCREPIPLARLEAVPTTELCIRCAELREAQAKKA